MPAYPFVKFAKTFECVGNYYDAADEATFKNVINIVISQAMNTSTAQVNLLDKNGLLIQRSTKIHEVHEGGTRELTGMTIGVNKQKHAAFYVNGIAEVNFFPT